LRLRHKDTAATLGNSRVGAEIQATRLMVRNLVETAVSGNLDPLVRKRLTEVVQLLQVYARLAELEMVAGEAFRFPRKGSVALPEDAAEKAKEWAEGEVGKVWEREQILSELDLAMEARGYDTYTVKAVMGG
jgi:hypothetical protein